MGSVTVGPLVDSSPALGRSTRVSFFAARV